MNLLMSSNWPKLEQMDVMCSRTTNCSHPHNPIANPTPARPGRCGLAIDWQCEICNEGVAVLEEIQSLFEPRCRLNIVTVYKFY